MVCFSGLDLSCIHVRNRVVNPEASSPVLGNREVLGNGPAAPGPIRLGNFANTTYNLTKGEQQGLPTSF